MKKMERNRHRAKLSIKVKFMQSASVFLKAKLPHLRNTGRSGARLLDGKLWERLRIHHTLCMYFWSSVEKCCYRKFLVFNLFWCLIDKIIYKRVGGKEVKVTRPLLLDFLVWFMKWMNLIQKNLWNSLKVNSNN